MCRYGRHGWVRVGPGAFGVTVIHDNLQLFAQLGLALVAAGVYWLLGAPARLKPVLTAVVAVATYGIAFPLVAGLAAVVYVVASTIRSADTPQAKARRWRLSQVSVVGLIAAFVALRLSSVGSLSHGLGMTWAVSVLDMWLTLRLAMFLHDVGSGRVGTLRAADFFMWTFLPFQIFGPLLRYPAYLSQMTGAPAPVAPAAATPRLSRTAAFGLAQLLAAVVLGSVQARLDASAPYVVAQGVALGFSAPWSFYLMTAGYFKMMELAAAGWGLTLPPSFNNPFAKRNLSTFWASWNMTVTGALRDAVFYRRWTKPSIDLYINTCLVFVLVGAWHGTNAYWLLWGALHAIGFCVYLAVSRAKPAPATAGSTATLMSWATTYVFVVSCWAAPPQIIKFGGRLF